MNGKPGVLAVMDAQALVADQYLHNDYGRDMREARAIVQQMALVLAKIVFDWDGEPEDMQDAKDALAAFKGEQS